MKTELNDLVANDQLVASLCGAVNRTSGNLMNVAPLIQRVIETGAWRKRENLQLGEVIEFSRFRDFIETPPLRGCGWNIEKVEALLKFDPPILTMFLNTIRSNNAVEAEAQDKENVKPAGPPKGSKNASKAVEITVDTTFLGVNSYSRPTGNSTPYAHRRLRNDRPDLHVKVLAGELTPNAGMVEAGFRRKKPSRKLGPLDRILKILPLLTRDERNELILKLQENNEIH